MSDYRSTIVAYKYSKLDVAHKQHNEELETVRLNMVSSPEHLSSVLDDVFDPLRLNTTDCLYRVFLWLAFAGMRDTDTINVRKSDVDFGRMCVYSGSDIYQIYEEGLLAFVKACFITEFMEYRVRDGVTQKKNVGRVAGDQILRGGGYEKLTEAWIDKSARSIISRKMRKARDDRESNGYRLDHSMSGYELTYNRAYWSGVFYRMHRREQSGININFEELSMAEVKRKISDGSIRITGDQKRDKMSLTRSKNKTQKRLETEYSNWKKAFGYDE